MKKISRTLFLCFLLIISLFISSCSEKDGSGYIFRYSIYNDPKNLDPQMATDVASLNVINNMFVGLVKLNSKGTIENGVAKSYEISDDDLTYTFNLNNNYSWKAYSDYSGEVTADDFVFAFERLATKTTVSPYSEDYFCIKNFEEIYNGTENIDKLGVKADGKYTLTITLDYPNLEFINLLATPSAFPCNRDFFYNTKGKYGLETKSIASNGAFYLRQWQYDPYGNNNYLILKKNSFYNDIDKVYPAGINYFVVKSREEAVSQYNDKDTDCIIDNGSTKSLFNNDSKWEGSFATTSGIIFNTSDDIFKIGDVRKALLLATDTSKIEDIPSYMEIAKGMVPSAVTMLNKSFRELAPEPRDECGNPSLADYLWMSSITNSQKDELADVTMIASDEFVSAQDYKQITEQWNNLLGFYCPVEIIPDKEYQERIKSGDYKIAIYEISAKSNSPLEYLKMFETDNQNNISAYSNIDYDGFMEKSSNAMSLNESVDIYSQAEKHIVDNAVFIPVYYLKDYLIYNKDMSDIEYNPFSEQLIFNKSKKK